MEVRNVPITSIIEDFDQPRYRFNQESIDQLAESIKEVGLLNPIKVNPLEDGTYKIIFGHRRFRACKKLELTVIPAIISENESELDVYLEQLTENIQREAFGPIEEGEAFQKLLDKWNISKKWLASRLGKSEQYISKKIGLLIFGKMVKDIVHNGKEIIQGQLSEEQLHPLRTVDMEYRDVLAKKIADEQTSVNDVKKIASLFIDNDRNSQTKERLLNLSTSQMIEVWADVEQHKTEKPQYGKPQVVENDASRYSDDVLLEKLMQKSTPIYEKLKDLTRRVPLHVSLTEEEISSIDEMTLDERAEFLSSVDMFLDTLQSHVEEWVQVRDKAVKRRDRVKLVVQNNK